MEMCVTCTKCLFVGYYDGIKSYRLENRDVVFMEDNMSI